MEKDKIFFGENGLTSTSANYIANVAKESYRMIERNLNDIVLYTTTVKLLGNTNEDLIKQGVPSIDWIKKSLDDIAQMKSLIAWLREAIKAKDRLIEEANNMSYADCGIELPERPIKDTCLMADDCIATWNIKKRNRYYYLESLCATIGQYIHPDGVFARERNQLHKIINEPNELQGNGRDTVIYTRKPSLTISEVEETYMELQSKYRGYQSELNSMKHEIETDLNQDQIDKSAKFQEEMENYQNLMKVADATLVAKKKQAVTDAANLKIVIPDSLQPIYQMVNGLGKK